MRYTTKRTKAAKVLSIRALCITILQNLREMRKFFADRSYQKGGGNSRAQVRQARKGHPTLGLKEI